MEDITGHSASNPDEFLNNSPGCTLNAVAMSLDETETQSSAAPFVESSDKTPDKEAALQVSNIKANDEVNVINSTLGEQNSSPQDEGSDNLKSTEQVETSTQEDEMSSRAAQQLVDDASPAEIENDSPSEVDTTQGNLQVSDNDNSTVEVSTTTEDSKNTDSSVESDVNAVHLDISATNNDSTLEPHTDEFEGEGSEMAVGSENVDQTGDISPTQERQALESIYHIKWIKWKGMNTPIITQNENGPCPLLAIVNVLLLQRRITIPPQQEFVTSGQLMEYIGDCILEEAPKVWK